MCLSRSESMKAIEICVSCKARGNELPRDVRLKVALQLATCLLRNGQYEKRLPKNSTKRCGQSRIVKRRIRLLPASGGRREDAWLRRASRRSSSEPLPHGPT